MTQTNSRSGSYEQAKDLALVLLKAHFSPTLEQIASAVKRVMTISDDPDSVDVQMLIEEIHTEFNYTGFKIKETLHNNNVTTNSKTNEIMQSVYSFVVGKQYRRRDIYRIIGIPEDTKGGNWDTGYSRHGQDWFIFCNIGTPGRTGHDYENSWQGEDLLWFGKLKTHVSQPAIKSMLDPKGKIYIFTRDDSSAPFQFAGCGVAKSYKDTSPVTILWKFQ